MLGGVLTDHLEQPVARDTFTLVALHQRLRDQRPEQLERVELVDADAHGDRDRRVEVEAADAHRQAIEQRALVVGEQVVGPVDRGPQGLVPFQAGAPTAREEPELLVEACEDLARGHHLRLRRGQLDRQRDPVETNDTGRARPAHSASSSTSSPRASLARATNNAPASDASTDTASAVSGTAERRQRRDVLAPHAERLTARRQDRHRAPRAPSWRSRSDDTAPTRCSQLSSTNNSSLRSKNRGSPSATGTPCGWRVAHRRRDRTGQVVGIEHLRQLAQPHPVRIVRQQLGADLEREAGLAHPAHAHDRDHPR